MPEEPTWAVVLNSLYKTRLAGEEFHEDRRIVILADEIGRSKTEISNVLSQMSDQGLINIPSSYKESLTLTEKGFDVAHTRELRRQEQRREQKRDKRQHDVNRAIGFLTVGLLFTGFLQAWIAALVGEEARLLFINGALLLGFGVVVGIAVLLWTSGMLASWDSDGSDEGRRGNRDENENEAKAEDESGSDEDDESEETAIDDNENVGE